MSTIAVVITNCSAVPEARKIGEAALAKRLTACYDVSPRSASGYFWPPLSGRVVRGRGTTLVCITLPKLSSRLRRLVRSLHSDQVPFLAHMSLDVEPDYYRWISEELK